MTSSHIRPLEEGRQLEDSTENRQSNHTDTCSSESVQVMSGDDRNRAGNHQEFAASLAPRLPEMNEARSNRLGLLLQFSIFTSLLALTIAMSFLSWLWWASRETALWRSWVLVPNRLQLSITLSSVIMRTSVSVLASISTTMIASVAVERRGVHLTDMAFMSISRFTSKGPLSFVSRSIKSSSIEIHLRILLIALVVTTLLSQFISTLLTLDLQPGKVSSFPYEVPKAFMFGEDDSTPALLSTLEQFRDFLVRHPRLFQSFAEYSESSYGEDGFEDTDPTVRAFLPVAAQEAREKLTSFTGMTRIFDSRVICLAPTLGIYDAQFYTSDRINVRGKVTFDTKLAQRAGISLTTSKPTEAMHFSCEHIIDPHPSPSTKPIRTLCYESTLDPPRDYVGRCNLHSQGTQR
ncbi:hypothetical protein CNYM01_00989 [Colletotrichum nymphaeae SA-01]|uniref:Uncharacterized protein n=1 Tax=Colletotrichum nymphaeae SA-01 TaxID=1460502 RepID=A0A135S9B8_9PEZI|nr:hypothetical protein CNYM01_00989 [Colletotrichum nymphaeae SA-01]